MSEWKECTIGELCSNICSGGTPNRSNDSFYNNGNIPWLNTKEVSFNRIYQTENFITELGLKNSAAKWIPQNTVVVAMYGATAGKSAIVKIPVTTNQACCNLTIDGTKADYRFVYYSLFNRYEHLASLANGGAQQNLNAGLIREFKISVPELETQTKIADILSSLDDKIELNNQINRNLEEQAQAIFKNWFVDFEPFGGEMPRDWKTIQAQEYFTISIGKTPPRKEQELFSDAKSDDNLKWVSISDMGSCGMYISDSSEYLTKEAVANYNICIIPDNTVILSFKLTVGRIAITDGEMTSNEAIAHFCSEDKSINEYLYCYLKNFSFETMGSTSSIATAVNSKIIKAMPFILPIKDTINRLHKIMKPLFDTIRSNQQETKKLISIRDGVLPKLMSGKLNLGS